MLIAILIILFLIIATMLYSIFRIQKNYKLDIEKNTIYREILYIKALLVLTSIVLVFFGWNISVNVKNDISKELKTKIEQDFSTALEGFIVEVPLDTTKVVINYEFNNLTDFQGKSIKSFEKIPIVSLNYVGQPYTITNVTNDGFTVIRLAIFKGYTVDEMKPPSFNKNKLIIWIINRD